MFQPVYFFRWEIQEKTVLTQETAKTLYLREIAVQNPKHIFICMQFLKNIWDNLMEGFGAMRLRANSN